MICGWCATRGPLRRLMESLAREDVQKARDRARRVCVGPPQDVHRSCDHDARLAAEAAHEWLRAFAAGKDHGLDEVV